MTANQADANVRVLCRVLQVSASGYYAWRDRVPSARAMNNAVLTERIRQVHAESQHTYGMPRVRAELLDQGVMASRKRVARLMRMHGIRGISRRRGFTVTTRRDAKQPLAPDLVQGKFVADAANQLWVADMTYVLGRLHLPRCRAGCMEPACRGLVHRRDHDGRSRAGGLEQGAAAAQASRRDPP